MAAGVRLMSGRSAKMAEMLRGQAETLERISHARATVAPAGFDLWVHAASLGEFEQARPVIEAYRKARPGATVLLSFFSPSGYTVRHNYDQVDCVVYLPFDRPADVRRFLNAAEPKGVVFVKYEFWSNYLHEIARRNIPLYLISSIFRPGQRFFQPWGVFSRDVLHTYTHIFVQDERSRELLAGVGVRNVTVAGDTRFDRVAQIADGAKPVPVVERWLQVDEDSRENKGHKPFTLVVGSSWPQDEACYIPWLNVHPEVKAIVAPHEFDDKRLRQLRDKFKGKAMLWSELNQPVESSSKGPRQSLADTTAIPSDVQVLIIDCYGLLSRLYRYGDAAIVGGGLGVGIHNINEAAVYGIPVAFGPNHAKFREASDLLAAGGAREYGNAAACSSILTSWLADAPARRKAGAAASAYIRNNVGATPLIMQKLLS